MNLNDSICALLKEETGNLVLGQSPEGEIYGTLEHHVMTGQSSKMEIMHKAKGPSVTNVVQQLVSQFNQAELQRTKIAPNPATIPIQRSKLIKP